MIQNTKWYGHHLKVIIFWYFYEWNYADWFISNIWDTGTKIIIKSAQHNRRQDPAGHTNTNVILKKSGTLLTMGSNSHPWFKRKYHQLPFTESETIQATSDVLHVRWSHQSHRERLKKMDQLNKSDINDISISYVLEKINFFLNELHLSRLWDFLSCKICFSGILYL